jgi:hypothetical protein
MAGGDSGMASALEALHRGVSANAAGFEYHAERAKEYGLALVTYESGYGDSTPMSEQQNDAYTDFLIALQRQPDLYDVEMENYQAFQDAGGSLYMNFGIVGQPSKWGSWSALENLNQGSSPRFDALTDWIASHESPTSIADDLQTDTASAIMQIFQFMAGRTPNETTFDGIYTTIASLTDKYGPAIGWNSLGASLANSQFALQFAEEFKGLEGDAFIAAVTKEVFGTEMLSSALRESLDLYIDSYQASATPNDPNGEIRGKGYFIADMLHQASDINFGLYQDAADVYLVGLADGSKQYGDILWA